jgi:RHS repeat-associated protein
MTRKPLAWLVSFVFAGTLLVVQPPLASAKDIGAEPPRCPVCPICAACERPPVLERSSAGTAISRTEGNLIERVPIAQVLSASTQTNLDIIYNSYNADTSRAQVDTVMGYGWTHSFNVFLFSQLGSMFRFDGDGRVTRYKLGGGGTYTAAAGYFETLVKNPDGSFTLRQKTGTTFTFTTVPGTPFLVVGPVYRLTKVVDRNGNTTTLTYTAGNLTSVTDTYGRTLTFTYTALKKIASVTDPAGRVTSFQYDSTGRRLLKIIDPNGRTIQYAYNVLYQLTSKVDKAGRMFTYTYQANEPTSVRDSSGMSRALLSNPTNWATDPTQLAMNQTRVYVPSTTTVVDGRGNLWRYQYDSRGFVTTEIAPDGATTRYTYDAAVLTVTSVLNPNGHPTTYVYDSMGNRTQVTNALGHVTTYTYEPVFNRMTSMTDPRGRTTTYAYDIHGNMTSTTDPLGQTEAFAYDVHGNVIAHTDKNGHTTSYAYSAAGNLIETTDAAGSTTRMTYDVVGNRTSLIDANGRITTYQYDGMNRRVRETDATLHQTVTQYDGEGNRVQVVDRNAHSTKYQYDLRQRLIAAIDAAGKVESSTYDGNDNRTSTTDRNGQVTSFQYDSQNRRTRITDPLGGMTIATYDAAGNIVSEKNANGRTTAHAYDALERRVVTTDALGNSTQFGYDTGTLTGCPTCGITPGSRERTKKTDANGRVTYYKYDALDRGIKEVRKVGGTADTITASDAVTTTGYDPVGNRVAHTDPNGNTTTYQYDDVNRAIRMTNAAGDMTQMAYDPVGNLVTSIQPNGNVISYFYDALNRLVQERDSLGPISMSAYDNVGNRTSHTDGNGNTTGSTYDALNRLVAVTDPLLHTTSYQYDFVGNLLKTTDRTAALTVYTYDGLNRRTTMVDALGHPTTYQYDAVGNRTRIIDANGHPTTYQYDAVNRLTRETYADGTFRTFTYDPVGNTTSRTDAMGRVTTYAYDALYRLVSRSYPSLVNDAFAYDLSGRLIVAQRGAWPVTFAYDAADRVTQSVQNGVAVSYSYNIPGRTRTVVYPGGRVITESMDLRSRTGAIDDGGPAIARYTYDTGDRVLTRAYRNGETAAYTYNANNWTTSLEHAGATFVALFNYAYDNEGDRRFEEKFHDASRSEAYQYDAAHRLIDYKVGTLVGATVPVASTQTAYSLDPVGNWTTKTTNGVPQARSFNVVNELTAIDSTNLTFDASGNPLNDGSYTYGYDEENRLVRVIRNADSAIVGAYEYDALNRRVVKVASAGSPFATTVYLYDDARVIEERDSGGATKATYVYGNYVDEVLTMDRGGQTYYYHQNALWSVAAITNNAAAVVERYAYDAYGAPTVTNGAGVPVPPNTWGAAHSGIANPYLFTGRELDEETGLYSYRARQYDAGKGRFLQRDPIEFNPNLYEYVSGRPTGGVDPFGLLTLDIKADAPDLRYCGNFKWAADFVLDEGAPGNGYVIQHVHMKQSDIVNCDTPPRVLEPAKDEEYWEAFEIKDKQKQPDDRDVFEMQFVNASGRYDACCTKGSMEIAGEAIFYYGDFKLPADFKKGAVSGAGDLRATKIDPHLSGRNPATRKIKVSWNCCVDGGDECSATDLRKFKHLTEANPKAGETHKGKQGVMPIITDE